MNSPTFDRYNVLGVPISATSLRTASDAIHQWSRDRTSRFVFIRDVHGVMQAQHDPDLMALHSRAHMVTPDGMPLVWLGKMNGKVVSRTCGPDLIEQVMADSMASGLTHYFYGGMPGVAEALKAVFEGRYPGVRIVGADTPPFRPLSDPELDAAAGIIEATGADVIWIGISTPKQERLMEALSTRVGATLIGVGAAFDFHTGRIIRAPRWMRSAGLEWCWRLASEPRRLWRRYLILAPKFALLVAAHAVGLRKQ